MKKVIYSLLVATISFLSVAQTAVQPSGSGTSSDPYQISTLNNLYWLCENENQWDKHFLQTTSIDASSTSTWYSGQGFKPIGWIITQGNATVFNGVYNGGGYTISNLTINRPNNTTFGTAMFGALAYGEVKNLNLTNVAVVGKNQTGALVGICYECNISNSSSNGNVQGTENVGGLVGEVVIGNLINSNSGCAVLATAKKVGGFVGRNANEGYIYNCFATGNVSCNNVNDNGDVGGFAGVNYGIIKKSYAIGSASSPELVGGFVGKNGDDNNLNALIDSCYSLGSVAYITSTEYARLGGFAGFNMYGKIYNSFSKGNVNASTTYTSQSGGFIGQNAGGEIKKCYSTGNVIGYDCIGGFVGANYATNDNVNSLIEDCYSRGSVQGSSNNIGGFVGCMQKSTILNSYSTGSSQGANSIGGFAGGLGEASTISNSFWDTQSSGHTTGIGYLESGSTFNTLGKTTSEMKTPSTFTNSGWDFVGETTNGTEDIWSIVSTVNDGYPSLTWSVVAGLKNRTNNDFLMSEILIYPNPATDFIKIESEANIKMVTISDILSKIYIETTYQEINISLLPEGVYLLKVETDKGVITKKFSK